MRVWDIRHGAEGWPAIWLLFFVYFQSSFSAELSYSVLEELNPGAFVGDIMKSLGFATSTLARRNPRVVSESNAKYFDVNASGVLVTKEVLDREGLCGFKSACLLRVQLVLENPLELHRVVVEIVDVNDNSPQFPGPTISMDVSEAAAPGTRFRLDSANDLDVDTNALRTYFLSSNDCFALKVESKRDGSKFPELLLEKPLDREKQSVFNLVLTAVDGGQPENTGTTSVLIHVMDVNDNAPVFDQPIKTVSLLENSSRGTLVTTLNASDADDRHNGKISFHFSKYTSDAVVELFSLNPDTGEILVKGEIDYEVADIYDITVQARDSGNPALEGSCHIKVQIIDVNDNIPVISMNSVTTIIQEDVESGTVVALVSIRDEDAGQNGDVTVQIPPGLPFRLISPFEGHYTLVTDGPLDRETETEYTITVTASDAGSPPLSAWQSFVVSLSDVNDNAPVFSKSSYSVDIAENNAPGALILTLSASDQDLGQNARLSFSLLDSEVGGVPVSSLVYINSENGKLFAMRALDYELVKVFRVEVQARDAGSPARSTNVTVHVFVVDVNDHPPALVHPALPVDGVLQLSVQRSAAVGHLVNRVVCVDPDSGHNAWLFYSVSGRDAGFFQVGAHTGEVRTARRFEEGDATFSILILVQDNGTPTLSTTVAVNITVSDKGVDPQLRRAPRRHGNNEGGASGVTLTLISSLACISVVCLLAIAGMAVRWLRYRGHLVCLGLGPRKALRGPSHRDPHLQLNTEGPLRYVEVVGEHPGPQHFYPTLSSSVKDFVFVRSPGLRENQNTLKLTFPNKHLKKSTNEQKPPNDWRITQNQRPGPSGAGARPEEGGAIAGTGPWPNPPTEAEQLQALMAAANEVSEATATLGPRYNAQFPMQHVPDYRQNVYIPGSTATLTANPQQAPQQALPPAQAMPQVDTPKAAQTPGTKKKSSKKEKK